MEHYIKNVTDITYMPELIPLEIFVLIIVNPLFLTGLIRTITYSPPTADRKLCAH